MSCKPVASRVSVDGACLKASHIYWLFWARSTNRAPVDILEGVIGSNLTVAGCKQHPKTGVVSDHVRENLHEFAIQTFILPCFHITYLSSFSLHKSPIVWYCTSRFRDVQMLHGVLPNPSYFTTTCVAGSGNYPARGFSAKRSISRCVPSPERAL